MFDILESDIQKVKDTLLISLNPLIIKQMPAKEKRKYILLGMICHLFKPKTFYSEQEVNDILKDVYSDFVSIRRYLVDYKFLDRTLDGKQYWLIADLGKFNRYI